MKKNPKVFKIGIIGGGQLAGLLCVKATDMGLVPFVLSANSSDPAAHVCKNWMQGDIESLNDVKAFHQKVDYITFESEFLSNKILSFLSRTKKAQPSPKLMRLIQDRLSQKKVLAKYELPTSSFSSISSYQGLLKLKNKRQLPLVLKARKNGYDGYGTYILKSWTDTKVKAFILKYKKLIVEDFVVFKRELAISVAQSKSGDIVFLPLVETKQEDKRCLWVKGPVQKVKLKEIKKQISHLLQKEKYYGLITFELFLTSKGLVVNEVAPRVHNSAHYSLDALSIDQFSLHLKAVCGFKLNKPKLIKKGFAMYNLLGTGRKSVKSDDILKKIKEPKKTILYWYGKSENRKGRKMGHLNALAKDSDKALGILSKAVKEIKV